MSEEEGVRSSPYQSPMYNFAGSIITLTNPDTELHNLEMTLRNIVKDSKSKSGYKLIGEPLLNEEGITSVLGMTQAAVNRITVMSNLDKFEVQNIILFLTDTIGKDLMVNRVKYSIKNSSARDRIVYAVLTTAYICMKRATDEGERKFWKGSQQDIHMHNSQGQNKGSLMSRAIGWGSK